MKHIRSIKFLGLAALAGLAVTACNPKEEAPVTSDIKDIPSLDSVSGAGATEATLAPPPEANASMNATMSPTGSSTKNAASQIPELPISNGGEEVKPGSGAAKPAGSSMKPGT